MERLSLRIPGFENYLPDGCRVVGVLGDSCLLVEDGSSTCPAAYAVYIRGFSKGPFALVGHYVTPGSAVHAFADAFIDRLTVRKE
ncbi:hypothetical protein C814_03151 [Anaerotruncus sp. G3(2012)]|uniref:hypothetical protein n=1 Tax=Anaerotruncus sp. G3(2012) TaxID=1235835 RepID=UPI00033EC3B1|nr:hypothetical protein [Anaerotruncus sp. G3(2012)]EOS55305.1 hypothetical protein C814_03151 [Anaerotruncus sp. G3(2012)]